MSRTTRLIHIGMRSGNIEPLPLLGMRTIYLEEVGNHQGGRMQKLANAIPDKYERHQFLLPPTIKGQFNEAVGYFFDHNLRKELDKEGHRSIAKARLEAIIEDDLIGPNSGTSKKYQKIRERAETSDALSQGSRSTRSVYPRRSSLAGSSNKTWKLSRACCKISWTSCRC